MAPVTGEDPKLDCMNCGTGVSPTEGQLFLGVFVCADCKKTAELLQKRARGELKQLLTLLDETIRLALVEGRLSLPAESSPTTLDKKKVLATIVELMEVRHGAGVQTAGDGRARRRPIQVPVPE